MPYVLITTLIRLENGPTVVGDEKSDPRLMEKLEASLKQTAGNNLSSCKSICNHTRKASVPHWSRIGGCVLARHEITSLKVDTKVDFLHLSTSLIQFVTSCKEWIVNEPPRVVLNRLEALGYSMVGSTGIGQTAIWTLHKPLSD